MLIFFFPFVRLVCRIVGVDPAAEGIDPIRLNFALAAFHTGFNVINTALLIGFVPQIEKLVCRLIQPKKTEEDDEFRLQYIRGGLMKTPEISLLQAQKEIAIFGIRMQRMFGMVRDLYSMEDEGDYQKLFERIRKYEDISDRMENEIGRYIGLVGDAHLSDDSKEKIRSMLRQIGELESIGDGCYNLARILRRKRENNIVFTEGQEEGVSGMMALVDQALTRMNTLLDGHREDYDISFSEEIESRINSLRNALKQQNIDNLDKRAYGYDNGTVYMDLINEFEKTGDYVINVSEACLGVARNGIRFRGIQVDTDARTVTVDGEMVAFGRSEYEMLKLFLENPGRAFTHEELLANIWPGDAVAGEHTVDACVTRICKRIGQYSPHLVSRAGFGYCFEE